MRYSKPLTKGERALEDAFFRKETERLLEELRGDESRDAQMKSLSKALSELRPTQQAGGASKFGWITDHTIY